MKLYIVRAPSGRDWIVERLENEVKMTTRTITVACNYSDGGALPTIWGAAEGSDSAAALSNAAHSLDECFEDMRDGSFLWTVEIQWSGELPDGENRKARKLVAIANGAPTKSDQARHRKEQMAKSKQAIKQALCNKAIVRALNGLCGCPAGGWPQTDQAMRQLRDNLPRAVDRSYTLYELIDYALYVNHADRYEWRPKHVAQGSRR